MPTSSIVNTFKDISIGDSIICNYSASSNTVGTFSGLGSSTSALIPSSSSATPNGSFYWIYVGNDFNGRKIFVADRNIQHSISWDTLNKSGISTYKGTTNDYTIMCKDLTDTLSVNSFSSSSQYSSSYSAEKAFNNVYNESNGGWQTPSGSSYTSNQWLKVDFSNPTYVDYVRFQNDSGSNYLNTAIKNYRIEASNDDINWTTQHTGVGNIGLGSFSIARFTPTSTFRYWRIYILDNYGHPSYIMVTECEMKDTRDSIFNSNISVSIKLLTGGVSATDYENEYDEYIVESTLNSTITAGDSLVWNWIVPSWTSTSSTTASNRIIRGGATAKTYNNATASSTASSSVGFRPVLIFEQLVPFVDKYLVQNDINQLLSYNGSTWNVVSSSAATEALFLESGMNSITSLSSSVWSSFSGPINVLYFTNDTSIENKTIEFTGTPKKQLITPSSDFTLTIAGIKTLNIDATLTNNGLIKLVASVDQGVTWKAHNGTSWQNIALTENNLVQSGMTVASTNALTEAQWLSLTNQSTTIRFAYVLITTSENDQARLNKIDITCYNYSESPVINPPMITYQADSIVNKLTSFETEISKQLLHLHLKAKTLLAGTPYALHHVHVDTFSSNTSFNGTTATYDLQNKCFGPGILYYEIIAEAPPTKLLFIGNQTGSVTYAYSANGGTSYNSALMGNLIELSGASQTIYLKITIGSNSTFTDLGVIYA